MKETLLSYCLCFFAMSGTAQYSKVFDFTLNNSEKTSQYGQPIFDGTYLYCVTIYGGINNSGSVFKVKPDGTGYTDLLDLGPFFSGGGLYPGAGLTLSGGVLYGVSYLGGPSLDGNIFAVDTDGTGYRDLHDFTNLDGLWPYSTLIVSGGVLYGTTLLGGSNFSGTIFSINTDGSGFSDLFSLSPISGQFGAYAGSLVLSGGVFYVMTNSQGANNTGTIFSVHSDGSGYVKLHDFGYGTDGQSPYGQMTLSLTGDSLFGMTSAGGLNGDGCIFSILTNGTGYVDLFDFNGANGQNPSGSLTLSGNVLYGMTAGGGANGDGTVFAIYSDGTGYTDLLDFNGIDGKSPEGSLMLSGTVLYGTTSAGGGGGEGCFFSINTNGTGYFKITGFSVPSEGANPYYGAMTIAGNVLYGLTKAGGTNGVGNIFSIHEDGTGIADVLDFNITNGANPNGGLLLSGTTFYGMTESGGLQGSGCVFGLDTSSHVYTDLHDFGSGTDGQNPYGSLTLSVTGDSLFGMTYAGGLNGDGCIFSILTNGSGYVDLFDFNGTNGQNPYGSLTLSGKVLYGMASGGGTNGYGCAFSYNTLSTSYTDLHDFGSGTDGQTPYGSLSLSGNVLYGMTSGAGANGYGCIFSYNTLSTSYTDLHDFGSGTDGQTPYGSLTISGGLGGMTSAGGLYGQGCVFSLNTDGTGYTDQYDFGSNGSDGANPKGDIAYSGMTIYGLTTSGGTAGIGSIFKISSVFLPIELLSFSAVKDGNKVDVNWETATETNNNYFTVERSADGVAFELVAIVKGAGNSAEKINYATTDVKPLDGISYYRLKQTDFDGKYTYSSIAQVNFENSGLPFLVYPNPADPGVTTSLRFSNIENTTVVVVVYDGMGQKLFSSVNIVQKGNNQVIAIDPSHSLSPGAYLVCATSDNSIYRQKLVIK